ncbi:MAG: amino acid ABC transporter permease [Nitrospiraceae bacterium]|jgi:polar amino acid transport system permease protein|nr:amino acid ABC transporter permease [Nitrospiraceae bacterium]
METGLDFTVVWDNLLYFMIGAYPEGPLGGIVLTIYLAVVSCFFSFWGGLILGLMNVSRNKVIRYTSGAFVNFVRGMPLLMVIFWCYFLVPGFFGQPVGETKTVIVALSLFTSAYMSQIVKAGIESIPKGQTEAARSSGLKLWQVMVYVILPQGLRNMIPSFVNQFVSLIKDTSLAFIVGVSELTHVATQINNRSFIYPTEIFIFIAVIYFILCYIFTEFSRWLEKRLAWRKSI